MLIASPRLSRADIDAWAARERTDARTSALGRDRDATALDVLRVFVAGRRGYVGVSWGKDSVVVADLAIRAGIDWPLVWVRVEGRENPDCPAVRDAFLAIHPGARYDEIVAAAGRDLTSGDGFAEAVQRHGPAHVSGVRGEESRTRALRMRRWGTDTANTCAPIGWWTGAEVFAYLYRRGLPAHPAYAMSRGGLLDRDRLRVASLGGDRGTGMGRREWELHYYPEETRAALDERKK